MSTEENKALVRRWFEELFNQAKIEAANEIVAADHVLHDPTVPDLPAGPAGDQQFVNLYHSAFSDAHIEVEELIAEEDRVAVRWVGRGTNDGELMGAPASGNRVEVPGITLYRISGGKIAETWTNYDAMGMMQQLGAIPTPETPEA